MTDTPQEMIQRYYDLSPLRYARFRRLVIAQEENSHCLSLESESADGGRLLLRFDGVQELQIDWPQWSKIVIDVIDIVDVSTRGLEDINYRVHEAGGMFACSCREFTAMTE